MSSNVRMNTRGVVKSVSKASVPAMMKCGYMVQRKAVLLLGWQKGGGKMVVRYRPRRRHRVGPPGLPPTTDQAQLANSIATAPQLGFSGRANVIVGPTIKYGKVHELGVGRMPKRPFMSPALRQTVREFPKKFANLPLAEPGI